MGYAYILKNKIGKYYIGITALTPEERLIRHNKGDIYSTKFGKPWKIIHVEIFKKIQEARSREKEIKSWKGGNAFKKLISKVAGSSNGRTSPSEGGYLGSNPSPATLERSEDNLAG